MTEVHFATADAEHVTIDDYVTAVHAALADLPDAEREDLLDDLPQHLADVQADRSGSLVDLIGTPDAYAAELRSTAGLDASSAQRQWWPSVRSRLTQADHKAGSLLGYGRFVDLLRALAPGWWVVRAWLLVQVCTNALDRSGSSALVPTVSGSTVGGVLLLVVVAAGSVWLGRRGATADWQRAVLVLAGLALAVYGVLLVRHATQADVTYEVGGGGDTSGITNVFPVGSDGSLLKNVRLYDQAGNPIPLGQACDGTTNADDANEGGVTPDDSTTDGVQDDQTGDGALTYPLTCPADTAPFPSGRAPALPKQSGSGAATAPATSPAPSPSASATPTTPAPSASSRGAGASRASTARATR